MRTRYIANSAERLVLVVHGLMGDATRNGDRAVMTGDSATRLLTIDEVRSQLNVSISTVRRLVRDRKLRAYRVGGRLRFKPEEVAAYVDSQLVGAALPEHDTRLPEVPDRS